MKTLKSIRNVFSVILCICILFLNMITAEAAPNTVMLSNATFDADYYYHSYPDLQATIGYNYAALYNHYLQSGLAEGRSGSAEFNCMAYMNNNNDLRAAFQKEYIFYCLHYEQFGKTEGRSAVKQNTTVVKQSEKTDKHTTSKTATHVANTVIGTYSTNYNATIPRAINVVLAASRINGIILEPGQHFSFSQTILPRTPANGYVKAPVIVNRAMTSGYGGGICQVSSTLYAAMLNAGLPATERHPHSLPVSYMPIGMDATISSPVKDLKFVNIYDHAIQIIAVADNTTGTLTVSIVSK